MPTRGPTPPVPRKRTSPASAPAAKKTDSSLKEIQELYCLAKIREAIGDPNGKLMQDELVEKIRDLRNRTIEDCARHVETQEPGTPHCWMPKSQFGSLAGSMANQIRKLKTTADRRRAEEL